MAPNSNYLFTLIGLFAFGIGFNHIVNRMKESGGHHGYTAYLVIAGYLVTILTWRLDLNNPIHDADPLLWITACFAASGTPMAIGSSIRYGRNQKRENDAILRINEKIIDEAT
jgi:hypothetical protein